MKFKCDHGEFEIVTKQVVVNQITIVDGERVRDNEETRIWVPHTLKNGKQRWLETKWGYAYDKSKTLRGKTPERMKELIQSSMKVPHVRVWWSGDTCNIEVEMPKHKELLALAKLKERILSEMFWALREAVSCE